MALPALDRLVTVGVVAPCFRALRGLGASSPANRAPILMYHSISNDPEPGVSGYYRLNTPPATFRAHLEVLREEGYSAITLSEALRRWAASSAPAAVGQPAEIQSPAASTGKVAVITFDDGFLDFQTAAWPLLQEFGFSATMFLPTASIRRERGAFKGRPCLTWDEVRALQAQGAEFGSHTVNHPKLWELRPSELESELVDSRKVLEQQLGAAISSFAHPYAFPHANRGYVQRFRSAMRLAGYRAGVTTSLGRARPGDDLHVLKRLPANGGDDRALFRAKLDGAYDWLGLPQRAFKSLKTFARR